MIDRVRGRYRLRPFDGTASSPSARDWAILLPGYVFFELKARATGKPDPGQRPLFDLGGLGWWLVSTGFLFGWFAALVAVTSHAAAAGALNVFLVPAIAFMQLALVGRLRVQQVTFAHHAVHGAVSKRWPSLNRLVAEFATIVPLAQNPLEYLDDHVRKHHRTKFFTTIHDPDAAFLHLLGFKPGMSSRELYGRLRLTMVSPRFHGLFLVARARSSFVGASTPHKILAAAWLGALASLGMVLPWWVFLVAVVLPWGPLYHVAALLQFLTEHRWSMGQQGPTDRHQYAARCIGRFSLLPTPAGGRGVGPSVAAWAWWGLRMVPELLVRLGAWVGDLPAHDHHHLVGHIGHDPEDWHEAIFERQRSIDDGDPTGLATREAYGLRAALDWVFDGLSASRA